jgi:hypothetical protein
MKQTGRATASRSGTTSGFFADFLICVVFVPERDVVDRLAADWESGRLSK